MATATTGEIITADSTPKLDGWGWDTYWDCIDWIEWHKVMKQNKGKEYADATFLEWWNKQTTGAHALDCRSFNQEFRNYFKDEKLLDALYSGLASIAYPIGTVGDIWTSALKSAGFTAKAIENTTKVLKILLPIVLIVVVIILAMWGYKKFVK